MNIDQLIEKYYNGDTTPDEEAILSDYFHDSENMSAEKDIFAFFRQDDSNIDIDIDFENKVIKEILSGEKADHHKQNKLWKFFAAAAAVLIFLAVAQYTDIFNFSTHQKGIVINDENIDSNKDLAMAEAQKAFELLSNTFDEADRSFGKLEYLSKTDVFMDFFIDKNK